jgi:hypothetical protein
VQNVAIDIGKTFLSSALRLYPRFGVRTLDSVLITHEHADAMLGMDDIRSMQRYEVDKPPTRMPVHVSLKTLRSMRSKFDYLCDEAQAQAALSAAALTPAPPPAMPAPAACGNADGSVPATVVVERKVAQLDWQLMLPFVPFYTCGLRVLPLPVLHGEDYVSFAFLLGGDAPHSDAVLYISDVTRIPPATWHFLCTGELPVPPAGCASPQQRASFFQAFNEVQAHALPKDTPWAIVPATPVRPSHPAADSPAERAPSDGAAGTAASFSAPRISLLIVDALFPEIEHNTHFNMPQALHFIERLQPRRALLTGLSDLFEHERHNTQLQQRRQAGEITVDVQLAYDGLRMPLDL